MTQALHIDGLSNETFSGVIEPGTSIAHLIHQWGGTVRVESVPDKPRELDPEAAAFIRTNAKRPVQSSPSTGATHSLEAEEFDTVEEAERFLESGAEWGSLAGEAIVNGDGKVTVLP